MTALAAMMGAQSRGLSVTKADRDDYTPMYGGFMGGTDVKTYGQSCLHSKKIKGHPRREVLKARRKRK